ncbi:MAG: LamG domain-containing protein, partial [archaeon]|nr:LamG domain-containing protein [archaeon]
MQSKPGQPKRALTSRVVKLQVDKFISNREHCILTEVKEDTGTLNQSGFVEILNGGMKSTDKETLKVAMPPEMDLSIRQDNGFSVFLWMICPRTKIKNTKQVNYILKKGSTVDQLTPTVALTNNQSNLFVEVRTSKSKREIVYANKPIEPNHFYSVAVTFAIDYEAESTEVSIYLDGKLDTQSTIQGEPIHNQSTVNLGKPDSTLHGFTGSVADVIIVPGMINEDEVRNIHEAGLETLLMSEGKEIGSRYVMKEIFDRKKLIAKYAMYTGKPVHQIENLGMSNERMLEVVKAYDEEERKNDVKPIPVVINQKEEDMKANLKEFMLMDEDNEIKCYKVLDNERFLNTILYLANDGESTYEEKRICKIFAVLRDVLNTEIDQQFFHILCQILRCIHSKKYKGRTPQETITKYFIDKDKMFTNLERTILTLEQEQKLIDEENAKYKKKPAKKGKGGSIKSLYAKNSKTPKETMDEKQSKCFNHTHGQFTVNLDPYQTFGSCIAEHEDLLIRTQQVKNVFDEDEERALKDYHSNYVIKTLYEKPKNLPAVDPDNTEYTILDKSVSKVYGDEGDDDDENSKKLTAEDDKFCEDFVGRIMDEYEKKEGNHAIDIELVDTYPKAEELEKAILAERQRIEEEKLEKERALKRKEEEEKRKQEGGEGEQKKERQPTNFDPEFSKDWADGAFEIVINHCYNCCYGHRFKDQVPQNKGKKRIIPDIPADGEVTKSTRHYEYVFIDKFNEIGDAVKKVFPNVSIVGNMEEQDYLGNFDVYLRGTGLPSDELDRYYIYRKKDNDFKFPSNSDIIDHLVALCIIFGGSKNIAKAQQQVIGRFPRNKLTHDFPADYGDDVGKQKEELFRKKPKPDIDAERTKYICLNWGCGKEFVQKENVTRTTIEIKSNLKVPKIIYPCRYHPGVWQSGSYNRYWSACWSCGEGKYEDPGCKTSYHRGPFVQDSVYLCL